MIQKYWQKFITWIFSGSILSLTVIILAVLFVTSIAVYAAVRETSSSKKSEQVVETPKVVTPTEVISLLDGQLIVAGGKNELPVAVMIDNATPARSQFGLGEASVVYETLVEGGITRFMAVFANKQLDKIGPVRSSRPYFLEWISEYDGGYAHAGGSPDALVTIAKQKIRDISALGAGSKYFFRGKDKPAPHNLYTSSELLTKAVRDYSWKKIVPKYQSWQFADDPAVDARPATQQIDVKFSNSSAYDPHYEYDATTNSYGRSYGKLAHKDATTDKQIMAKNVIVVFVPRETSGGEKGRILLDVYGTGAAVIFRNGVAVPGTWKKDDRTSRTLFYDESGAEIVLTRGNTWVDVLPGVRTLDYTTLEGKVEWVGGVRK